MTRLIVLNDPPEVQTEEYVYARWLWPGESWSEWRRGTFIEIGEKTVVFEECFDDGSTLRTILDYDSIQVLHDHGDKCHTCGMQKAEWHRSHETYMDIRTASECHPCEADDRNSFPPSPQERV